VRVRTGVLGAGERLLGFLLHVTFLAYTRLSLSIPLTNVTLLCRTLYTHTRTHTHAHTHTHTHTHTHGPFLSLSGRALHCPRMHACTHARAQVVTSAGHGGVPLKTLKEVLDLTRAQPVGRTYTLYPIPYTLYLIPYTLYPIPLKEVLALWRAQPVGRTS
jgi:hypothetical protein